MLKITPEVTIKDDELELEFIRASGPGGQNVNKVSTAVQLRFNTVKSHAISANLKKRLLKNAGRNLLNDGTILLKSQKFRTQEQNRREVLRKFAELIRKSAKIPKTRIKTRPPSGVAERRLKNKRSRAEIKRGRKFVPGLFLFFLLLAVDSLFGEEVSVMSYNLHNYFVSGEAGIPPKDEFSKIALTKIVKEAAPDIMILIELGGKEALRDFLSCLERAGCEYGFSDEMRGEDDARCLGIIAKFPPAEVEKKRNLAYKITPKNGEKLPPENVFVQRGFFHLTFMFDRGYRLHIIGAHLKSKTFHWRYNQTDMRRYEARLLRHFVDDIMEKESGANILVVGDMNDAVNSDPMITMRSCDRKAEWRLYDLRPKDCLGTTWTHWWKDEDVYSRIDYALVSSSLLPEINFQETKIAHAPEDRMSASDHRPVFVKIKTVETPAWTQQKIEQLFPDGIYRGK